MPTSKSIIVCFWLLMSALIFALAACKAGKSKLPETTNSIGITMVTIPSGSFTMGEASKANNVGGHNNAYPAHAVTVQAFQLAKTEVTVGQYKKFLVALGRDGLRELQDTDFLKYNSFSDDAPVVNLGFKEVSAFIEWLNSIDGGGYRLPSEAEWEYACRAGGNDTYCGGEDIDSLGWYDGNSGGKTHPVAQKEANAFGLYDMTGNAVEWVEDCWHSNYHGAPVDGRSWETSDRECKSRVVRGGSWNDLAGGSRATFRDDNPFRFRRSGIRLARDALDHALMAQE